jgi:hypothetical protein
MIQHKPKRTYEHGTFWRGLMVGTVLAFVAFLFLGTLAPQTTETPPRADTQVQVNTQTDLTFTIGTRLGTNQIKEVIEVYVEGEYVGDLFIDTADPVDSLTVTVDEPGVYDYRINSVTWYTVNGRTVRQSGNGSGTLDVQQHDHFSAYFTPTEPMWQMSLLEE